MPAKAPIHRPRATTAPTMTMQAPARNRQAKRAMATNSAAWLALRRAILLRDSYTCQHCGRVAGGKGEAHVDHVDGNDANRAHGNLQTLCRSCHSAKTGRENGGFGNRRTSGQKMTNC